MWESLLLVRLVFLRVFLLNHAKIKPCPWKKNKTKLFGNSKMEKDYHGLRAYKSLLLQTIRVPKNLHYLTDKLPKSNYNPLKTRSVDKYKFLHTVAGKDIDKHNNSDLYDQNSRLPSIKGINV